MIESSTEVIEIDGKEYTLFLNRKGIISWEKFCNEEQQKVKELQDEYNKLINDNKKIEIKDDTNPFENLDVVDKIDEDKEFVEKIYKKLYWILLYTNNKLSFNDSSKLYDKACEEYGEEQIILLAKQMLEDANSNNYEHETKQLKNLAALRPAKK